MFVPSLWFSNEIRMQCVVNVRYAVKTVDRLKTMATKNHQQWRYNKKRCVRTTWEPKRRSQWWPSAEFCDTVKSKSVHTTDGSPTQYFHLTLDYKLQHLFASASTVQYCTRISNTYASIKILQRIRHSAILYHSIFQYFQYLNILYVVNSRYIPPR